MSKETLAGLAKRVKDLEKLILTYSGEVKEVESKIESLANWVASIDAKVDVLERLEVLLAANGGFFVVEEGVRILGLSPDKKIHELLADLLRVSEALGIEKK